MSDHQAASTLRRFQITDTSDPDELRDVLVNIFGARGFDLRPGEKSFRATASSVRLKSLDLSHVSFSAGVHAWFPPADLIKQQFPLRGSGRATVGRSPIHVSPNETCVLPAGADGRLRPRLRST